MNLGLKAMMAGILVMTMACGHNSRKQEADQPKPLNPKQEIVPPHDLKFDRVKKKGVKDTLVFTLQKAAAVKMQLSLPAGQSGNIRINQLIAPNGEMDGPFGSSYSDSLKIPGTYKVIIAESLMQENPYEGSYEFSIRIGN